MNVVLNPTTPDSVSVDVFTNELPKIPSPGSGPTPFGTGLDDRTSAVHPGADVPVPRYPHVEQPASLIDTLETYMQLPVMSIGRALRINRHILKSLRAISNLECFKSCRSCLALVATTFDMVVGLYNAAIRNKPTCASADHSPAGETGHELLPSPTRRSIAGSTNVAPIFRFGSLELEPEEQALLRKQITKMDLQKLITIIEVIYKRDSEESQVSSNVGSYCHRSNWLCPANGCFKVKVMWYEEIGQHARDLLISLR